MKATRFSPRFPWAVAVLAAVLAGCGTVRVAPPPEVPVRPEAAERAEQAGEYVLAAREYSRLAHAAQPPQKQHFQLRAADALIKAGQAREARDIVQGVKVAGLDSSFAARRLILLARILASEGAHEKAIRQLDEAARTRNLDPNLIAEIHRVRAQQELALNNPIGAVRNLVQRESYIVGKEAIAENQVDLWKILSALSRSRLAAERDLARDPALSGWIDLALAASENAGSPSRLATAIARWRQEYPKHPAGEPLLALIATPAPGFAARIDRIALLLPLTSSYALAAQAVRDGLLAMDAANSDPEKPKVKVYDTGADPAKAAEAYNTAVQEGAQVVIGPLGREAVDSVIRSTQIAVPTLLLSHTDEEAAAKSKILFQFGLPPEQEARQSAERAYLDGHRQAALFYPKNAWGERLAAAFTAQWQRLGGLVVATQAYQEDQNDYSESIKQMLNIEQSIARKDLLERKLGVKIPFEANHARRRQDVDFIFLAADAKRGRLIKPQLNFYQAARVPVYATSHIYTGKDDPVNDTDLDGVLFADMPWMLVGDGKIQELRSRLQGNWPHARSDLDRLYALGMDSYAILPHLNRIGADSGARFNGVTSGLSLDRNGRLHRHLLWAQFRKGVPRLIDTSLSSRGQFQIESASGG